MWRALALLVVVTLAVSAQSAPKCTNCEDDTARRERAARIEALRTELTRLVRDARQADTLTVRLLSEALVKLSETESRLKRMPKERTAAPSTPTVAGSGYRYGYSSDAQMPAGYMGISLSGNTDVIPGRDELVVRYKDTPIIESVEPGSPAEEAGLASGDVILAYNGDELKGRTVSLTRLLKPGAKVVVRVRRNGNTRDIPVLVGRRAQYVTFERITPTARGMGGMTPEPSFEWQMDDSLEAPTPPARPSRPARVPMTAPAAPAELLPPLLPGSGSALAGAELTASNRALGEYFGVSRGIVVLHVAEGTPARRSGLRVGDVITSCEGEPVSRPAELQDALWRASHTRRVNLEVQRRTEAGQPMEKKKILLKW